MAKRIITRRCWKCKKIKILSEFSRNKSRTSGFEYQCKNCQYQYLKQYYKTKKGQLVYEKAKVKYRQSEKGRLKASQYEQTDKVKKRKQQYKQNHTNEIKAQQKVNNAIRCKKIPRPDILNCKICNNTARDYHHHKGYEAKYHFDVIPVCRSCHKLIHKN